ncbi:MAG: DinB family protein [Chitinophagaceae bacterium]|jgi:hypothetical protein
MTDSIFKTWDANRKILATFLDNYSVEQLNKIPAGFSNNMMWNIGHIIAAQQGLVYRLSGLEMYIQGEFYERYKPGSKPDTTAGEAEVDVVRLYLNALVDKTKADYDAGKFVTFTERMTATGFHLGSLNDALVFNNYHEGLHLGVMMSIRKFV